MKKGPIIAFGSAVVLTALIALAPRSPKGVAGDAAHGEPGHVHTEDEAALNPLDAKVAQAVEIIQSGSQPPMAGVALLREVIEEDPQHIGALMWLGEFSVMSGQLDRAEARYLTVLALEKDNSTALEKLLSVYESTGQVDRAKEAVQEFVENNPAHPGNAQLQERLANLEGR